MTPARAAAKETREYQKNQLIALSSGPFISCFSVLEKNKADKTFGFSFVSLMRADGTTIPDGGHELCVYKVGYLKRLQSCFCCGCCLFLCQKALTCHIHASKVVLFPRIEVLHPLKEIFPENSNESETGGGGGGRDEVWDRETMF